MNRWTKIGLSSAASGSVASIASAGALALLARAEGKSVWQPINATSHWLYGKQAAESDADAAHTLVGYWTHHASSLFWALLLQTWLASRSQNSLLRLLRDSSVMAALAAAVDYGATPRRLTPGWELVLSKRAIVAAYGALALGLTGGLKGTSRARPNLPAFG